MSARRRSERSRWLCLLLTLGACTDAPEPAAVADASQGAVQDAGIMEARDAAEPSEGGTFIEPASVLALLPKPGDDRPFFLSATGLYRDIRAKSLHPRAHAFTPSFPLWSDGSEKQRWLILPRDTTIDVRDRERWTLPIGTLAFKEFRSGTQRLETRLVARTGPGEDDYWMGAFIWNEDESDALFSINGASNVRGTMHDVPKAQSCGTCHRGAPERFLGLSTVQRPTLPSALLSPAALPSFTAPGNALESAALGYLHANCAHCHNPNGSARPDTDLDLRLRASDRTPGETLIYTTTLDIPLQYFAATKDARRVIARDLANSALVVRMRERGNRTQMPALASKLIDAQGITVVEAWISQL
jgi:hypothetical protein